MKKHTLLKISVSFLILVSSLISFTSCNNNKRKDGKYFDSEKEIRIRVWESENGPDEFIREAAVEYRKTHPNIYVDYIFMDFDKTSDSVKVDCPNGIGPDLFCSPHDRLGDLVNSGLILPTEDPDYVTKSVLGSCSKALTYNGTMYGYPMSAETYALFYNKDLISENELPKSFEDLIKWNKDFKKKYPGKYSFVMDVTNAYYGILFMSKNNNRLFGSTGQDAKKPNINTKEAIEGYTFFQTLKNELDLNNVELTSATCDGLFVSGNAVMHISGPWNLVNFQNAGINFGVTTLPSLPGENIPAASFSGIRGMYVSAYSEHPKEAAEFAKFLLSPEMQKLRFNYTGAMPSVDVNVSSAYIPGFLKQLNYAFPMPSIPEMTKFWTEMGNTLRNIWNGEDVKTELYNANNKIIK